jgi:fructan beta-fructosidase
MEWYTTMVFTICFFQYYPDGTVWGPMHWGHAISKDLITWQEQPIALYPDSLGYIFFG